MAPRARRGGEVEGLKTRIAEAFVESIFRRAGYRVSRAGRDGQLQRPIRVAADEFQPDFLLHKRAGETPAGRMLHRLIPVDVRYCSSVEDFLRRHGDELVLALRSAWQELCIVFVTDHPASGRSCFQVLDLSTPKSGASLSTTDLHFVRDFDVYLTTAQEYEGLVRKIFPLLRLGGNPEPSQA